MDVSPCGNLLEEFITSLGKENEENEGGDEEKEEEKKQEEADREGEQTEQSIITPLPCVEKRESTTIWLEIERALYHWSHRILVAVLVTVEQPTFAKRSRSRLRDSNLTDFSIITKVHYRSMDTSPRFHLIVHDRLQIR